MSYVFDTGIFSLLFKNYYPDRFPTLWERFHELVDERQILSVREVLREINNSNIQGMKDWAAANHPTFLAPEPEEARFVTQIYGVRHFQQNIQAQALLKGGQIADPFVIAKAAVQDCAVVTTEVLKPNAAKIPNICRHFNVNCLSLPEFMEEEDWTF